MTAYQGGSYDAFEQLYFRHAGRVYAFLNARLRQAEEAQEILQQTFLQVHQSRLRYRNELPFLPWLFSICRNLMIDSIRRKRPTASNEMESFATGEVPSATNLDLDFLDEEPRRLLEMRFQEGLSFDEMALRTGTSAPTLRKRLSRLLGRLRKEVIPHG